MARIANVTVPTEKQVQISLTYIYGIGPKYAKDILETTKVDPTKRVKDLSDTELTKIRNIIDQDYNVEGDLQRVVSNNIKRLAILALPWVASQERFAVTRSPLVLTPVPTR